MKKQIILVIIFFFFELKVYSQAEYHLTNFKVEISGTSNLHDWTAQITNMTINCNLSVTNNELIGIQALNVMIDAKTIESSGGNIMDSKMKDALKAKDNPQVEYSLVAVKSLTKTKTGYSIETLGSLKIGGYQQPIDIQVSGIFLPNGALEFTGSKKLKMTSFNLTPPTAMFGALKTGDEVDVIFSLILSK